MSEIISHIDNDKDLQQQANFARALLAGRVQADSNMAEKQQPVLENKPLNIKPVPDFSLYSITPVEINKPIKFKIDWKSQKVYIKTWKEVKEFDDEDLMITGENATLFKAIWVELTNKTDIFKRPIVQINEAGV